MPQHKRTPQAINYKLVNEKHDQFSVVVVVVVAAAAAAAAVVVVVVVVELLSLLLLLLGCPRLAELEGEALAVGQLLGLLIVFIDVIACGYYYYHYY